MMILQNLWHPGWSRNPSMHLNFSRGRFSELPSFTRVPFFILDFFLSSALLDGSARFNFITR
jgi:hypothetical protein